MNFSDIAGNRNIIHLIEKGVRDETLYPSLIFHGKEGIGKKLTAMTVAKAFNCTSEKERPCGSCLPCRSIESHNYPDVRYILPEYYDERLKTEERKSPNLKIEQIREMVESISFKQYSGRKKVYIIDRAETLTDEAANALLKTLEEPPPYAVIIIITSAYHALLPTVRSRCWALPFNPIPPQEMENILTKKKGVSRTDASMLSIICEGSIGKAMQEDLRSLSARGEKLMDYLEAGIEGNIPAIIRGAEAISRNLEEFRSNLDALSSILRDITVASLSDDESLIVNRNMTERIKKAGKALSPRALRLLEKAEQMKELLAININKKVAAQAFFFEAAR